MVSGGFKKSYVEFAYPGMRLGVMEEFIGEQGVYYGEDGCLRSKYFGFAEKNLSEKTVMVKGVKKARRVEVGDEVLGRVSEVSGVYGIVKIGVVNKKPLNMVISAVLYPTRHLRRGERQYKIGDIVYAVVESLKNRTVHLSINGSKYGIILAYCSKCGEPLKIRGVRGGLICGKCGSLERRKLSSYYSALSKTAFLE